MRDRERPGGKTRREEWTREEGKQGERKTRIEERHGDREGDT